MRIVSLFRNLCKTCFCKTIYFIKVLVKDIIFQKHALWATEMKFTDYRVPGGIGLMASDIYDIPYEGHTIHSLEPINGRELI